jgi:hypothetical protein
MQFIISHPVSLKSILMFCSHLSLVSNVFKVFLPNLCLCTLTVFIFFVFLTAPAPSAEDGNEGSPKDAADETDEGKRRLSKEESLNEKDGYPDETKEKGSTEDAPGKYPKGVLIYHKTKKGPKKIVRWKQEKDLETIKYFELDETERGKYNSDSIYCLSVVCGLLDDSPYH